MTGLAFPIMRLRDFFSPDAVDLDLRVPDKAAALDRLVALLRVDGPTVEVLIASLARREQMGSTGMGRGIAIPHCRAGIVPELRLAFGRAPAGLAWGAIDNQPVHNVFLIVAPPVEVSNSYLPVLGRLAQFAKGPDMPLRLAALKTVEEFMALLDSAGG